MSIVPVSRLSSSDVALLGNNVTQPRIFRRWAKRHTHQRRAEIAAVNRSLAGCGESVGKLHRPLLSPA